MVTGVCNWCQTGLCYCLAAETQSWLIDWFCHAAEPLQLQGIKLDKDPDYILGRGPDSLMTVALECLDTD